MRIQANARLPGNHIPCEMFNVTPLLYHHNGVGNAAVSSDRTLDFTQFNSEAAKFYLMVNTAHKFQVAVRHPPNQITCSVQPRSRPSREWIGDKFFCSESRPVPVTTRHSRPSDV